MAMLLGSLTLITSSRRLRLVLLPATTYGGDPSWGIIAAVVGSIVVILYYDASLTNLRVVFLLSHDASDSNYC
jgi:hypothetical protein